MRCLILSDGSDGSLRCVEVACAAPPQPAASLTLLHVYDDPKARPANNAAASPSPSAAAAATVTAAPPASRSRGPSIAASAAGDVAAAAAPSTSQVSEPAASASTATARADVLTATLRSLHTNKYIKGRAHYAVECVCASVAAGEESKAVRALYEAVDGTVEQRVTEQVNAAEPPRPRIGAVVRQAASSAADHHVDAVFLGVGQHHEGKLCRVGGVASEALHFLRALYPLYFVKRDGVKWRPLPAANYTTAAAPLRFTIVVPLQAAPEAEAAGGHDASGESALLSPQAVSAIELTVRYVQRQCLRSSASPAAAAATVGDMIDFLLITPSFMGGEESGAGSQVVAAPAAEGGGAEGSILNEEASRTTTTTKTTASMLEACKRFLTALLPPDATPTTTPSPEGRPDAVLSSAPTTAADDDTAASPETQPTAPDAAATAVTEAAVDGDAQKHTLHVSAPSRVAVCALKATKKHPRVTLDDNADVALPQVVKHLISAKPDVLVLPSSLVSDALQRAALSVGRPHCVTLPW